MKRSTRARGSRCYRIVDAEAKTQQTICWCQEKKNGKAIRCVRKVVHSAHMIAASIVACKTISKYAILLESRPPATPISHRSLALQRSRASTGPEGSKTRAIPVPSSRAAFPPNSVPPRSQLLGSTATGNVKKSSRSIANQPSPITRLRASARHDDPAQGTIG